MSTYLITGSNRGIGLEFVRKLAERGETVIATCRDRSRAEDLQRLSQEQERVEIHELDVADAQSISSFGSQLGDRPVDVLINNAGVYGPREAGFGKLDEADWQQVLQVNSVAPLLLTQKLMASLRAGSDKKLVFITSKMGSIGDNGGGGQYIYRSSKAALNAAVKSLSIDLADDGFKVAMLHPGWVLTDMGGSNALIDTDTSVRGMLEVIDGMSAGNSGQFTAYDGQSIPW